MCISHVIRESLHFNSLDAMLIYLDPSSPVRKLRYSSLNKEGDRTRGLCIFAVVVRYCCMPIKGPQPTNQPTNQPTQ